jgi:2-keto-4-pentenoate hydratase/2-oxohepta-3-ene-1,7-dioic acid hydratase in catechol pathway
MRWVTFRALDQAGPDRVGLVIDQMIHTLGGSDSLQQLLGGDGTRLSEAAERARRFPAEVRALSDARLLPPIPQPRSIRDYSSFEDHYRAGLKAFGLEFNASWYESPMFYFSNNNVVIGEAVNVRFPRASRQMDYELEVAAIIGREGIDLSVEEAESCIAGYTIFNDWSARDLLRTDLKRSLLGPSKGKDSNNGMGPCLVTSDELEPRRKGKGFDLEMTAHVNGREYSRGNWSKIHWSFAEMLAHASRDSRVVPGDVIASGTVGTGCIMELLATHGANRYPYLEDGDEVVLAIEGLGELRNKVYRGPAPHLSR